MVLSFWGNVFLCKLSQYFQKWLWPSPDQRKCYRKKNGQNKQHLLTFFNQHVQYNLKWKHTIWSSDFKDQIVVDPPVLHFKTSQVKNIWVIREAIRQEKCSFFEHCSKGLWPPPLYLNICPILQGVFFKTRFWALKMVVIMYLFHPQISPSMPQKSLFMQISCC